MTGRLVVLGIGPGHPDQITPEAARAIAEAEWLFGYKPYLERLSLRPDQIAQATDNREELQRAKASLQAAAAGHRVAMVSGGDPGVFAMAAAVCEAIETGPPEWRALDVSVLPGVTAMLSVAARIGAPLGHDFCAISLSNNFKPWSAIEDRLMAAATSGFVIALYNPISRARPTQLASAFALLQSVLPPTTLVIFGRAVGRVDERISISTLAEASGEPADMATCIIVGSRETRVIPREGKIPLVYTPRFLSEPRT
jgi:precorrin-3B C17-methyltransferase